MLHPLYMFGPRPGSSRGAWHDLVKLLAGKRSKVYLQPAAHLDRAQVGASVRNKCTGVMGNVYRYLIGGAEPSVLTIRISTLPTVRTGIVQVIKSWNVPQSYIQP